MNFDIKEHVKDGRLAKMLFCNKTHATFETETAFIFRVPLDDIGNGVLYPEERAIKLMKWIKKDLDKIKERME
jgi:hypothetical protein